MNPKPADEAVGTVYTLQEAADKLRISKRNFQEIIKRHPYYFKNGKIFLFTEGDLVRITEALRSETTLSYIKDPNYGAAPMLSGARLDAALQKFTAKKKRPR